jgi:hypothetical protein
MLLCLSLAPAPLVQALVDRPPPPDFNPYIVEPDFWSAFDDDPPPEPDDDDFDIEPDYDDDQWPETD